MTTPSARRRTKDGEKLAAAARIFLHCGDDFGAMRQAAEQMYGVFSTLSGVTADDCTSGTIMLPSGKAIAPGAAAHCLLEFRRTTVFVRGLLKAINTVRRKKRPEAVRILYAGCGPYATLITPLLTHFAPKELQVDLLDINQDSLNSARKIVTALGFDGFVGNYLLTDAATYRIPLGENYDILLTETMQACLERETQVAIVQNLVPQLPGEALLVPEAVVIDARLTDPQQEMAQFFYSEGPRLPPQRILLGEVMRLTRDCLDPGGLVCQVAIPAEIATCVELKLFTTVRVFGDEVLKEHDSSITLPKKYHDFRQRPARRILFWYDRTANPKLHAMPGDES